MNLSIKTDPAPAELCKRLVEVANEKRVKLPPTMHSWCVDRRTGKEYKVMRSTYVTAYWAQVAPIYSSDELLAMLEQLEEMPGVDTRKDGKWYADSDAHRTVVVGATPAEALTKLLIAALEDR